MIAVFIKTLFIALGTLTAATLSVPLALGAMLAAPFILLLSTPLAFAFLKKAAVEEKYLSEAFTSWQQLPDHRYFELMTETYESPMLINHRNSTEILYANFSARYMLGENIVGRTVDSEKGLLFKPLLLNGKKVDPENHPANIMKHQDDPLIATVLWSTPAGNVPFYLAAKSISKDHQKGSDYLLLTLYPDHRSPVKGPCVAC